MNNANLNSEQIRAIQHTEGTLLIIAGAGTGKTTVIANKIAYLIQQKLAKPEEILALTFTDKAAHEMLERVDQMINIGYVDLQISTFHSFCQKLLEDFGFEIGIPNQFKLLTDTESWLLFKRHFYDFGLNYYAPLGSPSRHISELLTHFSKCKDELIAPSDYLNYAQSQILEKGDANIEERDRTTEIANAYHTYNQLLLDLGALDFGDLIYYSVKLFKERKNILAKLQNRYKYILVDEFQDINWAQYVFIRFLSEHSNLTVVGDDDQSIYAFRGSNVSIIMRFKEDFKNCSEIILSENYRSSQQILNKAYSLISNNNPDRLEIKLGLNKKLFNKIALQESDSDSVVHLNFSSGEEEARGVAETAVKLKNMTKCNWKDFVVLVRANSHAKAFVNAFESAGVPCNYLSSSGLFRQPIVLDCINYFKLLDNYKESSAVHRLLCMPFLDFDENDLNIISSESKIKSVSYIEILKKSAQFGLSEQGIAKINKVLEIISNGFKKAKNEKPSSVLYYFLEKIGYLSFLLKKESDLFFAKQILYLQQFFNFVEAYENTASGANVAEFMEYFMQVLESGDAGHFAVSDIDYDAVNIMTAHSAKGLEFKYVFVVNLVEERFPLRRKSAGIEIPKELTHENSQENDIHYQEERRLFYVCMTRAKEKLFLSNALNYGGAKSRKISRFLNELGYVPNTAQKNQKTARITHFLEQNPLVNNSTDAMSFEYENKACFSYSQIKMYSLCPYKYKLSNILKIPQKGSPAFSFGTTIHNTLQEFYKRIQELNNLSQGMLFKNDLSCEKEGEIGIKTPAINDLMDIYEKKWISDWYENERQKEGYFKKGKDILKSFYEANSGSWTVPIALESYFKVIIGGCVLSGRIDRIDKLENGDLEIIDYKTGASKENLVSDDKEQLVLYHLAIETLPEYKNIGKKEKLSYYFLEQGQKLSFECKKDDEEKFKNKLNNAVACIHNKKFEPKPNKAICEKCVYRDICEFRA
jgi:DNA helicase-2/ATP-dependent DNA helicase PcrA